MAPKHRRSDRCRVRRDAETGLEQLAQAARRFDNHLLLIQPNPASALNEAAGKLASEDWDGYCRRAKLMTEIHAAIPSNITEEVREAQSRGEEKDIKAEAKAVEAKLNTKGKAKAKVTPMTSKLRTPGVVEDEENSKQRSRAAEDSDPESDWIPGPTTLKTSEVPRVGRSNIFGIYGLENNPQLQLPEQSNATRGLRRSRLSDKENEIDTSDITDPFITIPSKRSAKQSFTFRVPSGTGSATTDTPELLKFSDKNPFSAIQPNNQNHPLIREFSWSWADSDVMNNSKTMGKHGETKAAVRKRLASDEFEKKRVWELKRFKKAGYDLKRYNRGDFGPKTGLKRL